ncbi:MAG: CheR family methyltransferase [Verrucomicrobiota bacterium JB023]|nr:CheR family methyltransferase [Verrucomicrobiota bacterium JB023]
MGTKRLTSFTGHPNPVKYVGIGASAGGLEALESFFERLPLRTGMAYFVVQHLSPDYKSQMDELLGRRTKVPIKSACNEMQVQPDTIYLLPPKREMILSDGKILVTDKDRSDGVPHPIDNLFRSLAQDAGRDSVAVVLSGTGQDGSRGAEAISQAGGEVFVQDPGTARFDGMPLATLHTVPSARSMEVGEIPDALRSLSKALAPGAGGSDSPSPPEQAITPIGEPAQKIFDLLRLEHGIDFAHYKASTVSRRIERRADMNGVGLEKYAELLRHDPAELSTLYHDLLIGVTKFFRDESAFERLAEVAFDDVFKQAENSGELRVWVAGCATGEEAYSLAILLDEERSLRHSPVEIKIFATDVHRRSLEFASRGLYQAEALENVSSDQLKRCFTETDEGFRVKTEIRRMVVFAHHNVIKSAPFTRMNLVTCRNLLIYLRANAQKKALSLFHFGLRSSGYLFLGPSESPGELADEFQPADNHWKIYRKRRDVRLTPEPRAPLPTLITPSQMEKQGSWDSMHKEPELISVYDQLLNQYMPASVLVDEAFNLVHIFPGAERYLNHQAGRPSTKVVELLKDDLRPTINAALQHTLRKGEDVSYLEIPVKLDDQRLLLDLHITAVEGGRRTPLHYLLTFEEKTRQEAHDEKLKERKAIKFSDATKAHVDALEQELRYTRENLQATIEELETSNEELQATNEELVASNEELQSANEELHSVNEELHSVNAEHQRKIDELSEMTSDMEHLLASTDMGVIFLDNDLTIRKFTPRVTQIFNLMPQDIGRSISHFAHSLLTSNLVTEAGEVLQNGKALESECFDRHGNAYLKRILPYRRNQEVEGVVLTFVEITQVKEALVQAHRLSQIIAHTTDFVGTANQRMEVTYLNPAARELTGVAPEEPESSLAVADFHEPLALAKVRDSLSGLEPGEVLHLENQLKSRSGEIIPVSQVVGACGNDETGEVDFFFTIARDEREKVKRQQQLTFLAETLRIALNSLPELAVVFGQDGEMKFSNAAFEKLQNSGDDATRLIDQLRQVAIRSFDQEKVILPQELQGEFPVENGERRCIYSIRSRMLGSKKSGRTGVLFILRDQTDLNELRESKSTMLDAVSHELKSPLASIAMLTPLLKEAGATMPTEQREEMFDSLEADVSRLSRSIHGLIDLSRLDHTEGIDREEADVSLLLSEAARNHATAANLKGVSINVDSAMNFTWPMDRLRMITVVSNLISNAIKYSPEGEEVSVKSHCEEDELIIDVSDKGPGIPTGKEEQIFERFHREDRSTKTGSGLGLHIARRFAESHGGSLRASNNEQGALFRVRIPRES